MQSRKKEQRLQYCMERGQPFGGEKHAHGKMADDASCNLIPTALGALLDVCSCIAQGAHSLTAWRGAAPGGLRNLLIQYGAMGQPVSDCALQQGALHASGYKQ